MLILLKEQSSIKWREEGGKMKPMVTLMITIEVIRDHIPSVGM